MDLPEKPKLADALKGQPKADAEGDDPNQSESTHPQPSAADIRQSNAEANEGIDNQDERLVRLGRGHDTKGRGSQKG